MYLGHTHTDSGHDHSIYEYERNKYSWQTADECYSEGRSECSWSKTKISNSHADIQESFSGIKVKGATGGKVGHETRPVNMVVEYIIKIY